jgi:hypothetical protein
MNATLAGQGERQEAALLLPSTHRALGLPPRRDLCAALRCTRPSMLQWVFMTPTLSLVDADGERDSTLAR